MFYGFQWREEMTAIQGLSQAWRKGLAGIVLNLLCWSLVFALSPPVEALPFSVEPTEGGMQFASQCWDCPAFSAFGREFGSTWDLLPVKLFLLANLPAIRAAKGPEDRWGKSALSPTILLFASSLQWFLLGAAWRGWRRLRRAKASPSVVEA